MYSLPLLIEAKPRILVGSNVMLVAGNWRIKAESIKDSMISLCLDNSDHIPCEHGRELALEHDTAIKVCLNKPGTEPQITIYAEKL
jgi:hypothetical protein